MACSWSRVVGRLMGLVLVVSAMGVGCAPSGRSSELGTGDGDSFLPPSACPQCVESAEPTPPGLDAALACFDGCNWCYCTADGLVNCTARFCAGDGSLGADAGP